MYINTLCYADKLSYKYSKKPYMFNENADSYYILSTAGG
jgi:hypothetical protein